MKEKRKPRKTSKPFRKGQLNRLIDDAIHPFFDENKNFIWIDSLAHAVVEQNPKVSVRKFFQYNFPKLMTTKRKKKGKQRTMRLA